jgi:NTP pyrophosphatase (non-canonical NTP hydrolase)
VHEVGSRFDCRQGSSCKLQAVQEGKNQSAESKIARSQENGAEKGGGEMMPNEIEILKRAISAFGVENQMGMVTEECAEVIQAICKRNRAKNGHYADSLEVATNNLRSECADLIIMANQLALMLGGMEAIQLQIDYKLGRLLPRIEKAENAYNEAMVEILTIQKRSRWNRLQMFFRKIFQKMTGR